MLNWRQTSSHKFIKNILYFMKAYLLTTGCVHLLYISLNVCFLAGISNASAKHENKLNK
jgi:hypothetical protein